MRISPTIICGAAVFLISAASWGDHCGSWDVVPNPVFEDTAVLPMHIMPFGPDNAVGLGTITGVGIVHMTWDGVAWTVTPTEPLPLSPADVRGVRGLAPDDIWICGATVADAHGRPYLGHFDGQSWSVEVATVLDNPFPNGGDPLRSAEGADLAVIAPDDIWVVGAGTAAGVGGDFVACHWDGSNLEELEILPNIYNRINQVQDVDAAATDDVWAVGYGRNITEPFHAAMYHYDGSTWTPFSQWTPLAGQEVVSETLWDVATPAPGDAWAVGDKDVLVDGTTVASASLYLHWGGSSWTEVQGPDIGPLTSITASGPDDIWVTCAFGEFGGRLAHWDGTSWTEVQSAPFPGATHIGLANLATGGGCDVWMTGYWAIYDGTGGWDVFENIIEHLQAPAAATCPADCTADGTVNVQDLIAVIFAWGSAEPHADVDGNGVVGASDLSMVVLAWGACQ